MASDIKRGNIDLVGCKFISKKQADSLRKGFAKEGDVLLTHKASIGRTAIVPKIKDDYIMLTPQVTYYRVKNENILNNVYLKYYFNSNLFQNEINTRAGSGSTRAYIGITDQQRLPVVIPPLKTQKQIASILSALDDKIELNLQMNKTLEDMAMALYKHWFVDFGPFQNGEFVDSELGKIPKGWEVTNMGELVDLKQGLAINKKTDHLLCENGPSAIPIFKIRDLLKDSVEHYVKKDEVPKQCLAEASDLIFTRTGQVGYVFRWKEGCVHNNCFKVIPNDKLDKEYLYQFLVNPAIRELANNIASGSVQKDLNHTAFKSISIILPPMQVQENFRKIVYPWILSRNEFRKENKSLTKTRDTLLPKLISGEVQVKDVEQLLN